MLKIFLCKQLLIKSINIIVVRPDNIYIVEEKYVNAVTERREI